MQQEERRDVFISYNHQDKRFVERLAADLTAFGLSVWWDEWEMRVGDSLIDKINDGITTSSWLAVVLSPHSIQSRWVKRELAAALSMEIESDKVFVLPLLLDDCQLPPFLRDKVFADFKAAYGDGLSALLKRLSPPIDPKLADCLLSENESRVLRGWGRLSAEARSRYNEFLLDRLVSDNSANRLAALFALATLKDGSLGSRLPTLATDSSPAVRSRVAFYLGRSRRREHGPLIEQLLQDSNPTVRSSARTAFRRLHGRAP